MLSSLWPFGKSSSESQTEEHQALTHEPKEQDQPLISVPLTTQLTVGGLALTVGGAYVYWRFLRRISNTDYITPSILKRTKHIGGMAVRVGDGDGFRLYHQPGGRVLGQWLYPLPKRKLRLGDETLSIRLAGCDAPELPHFGKPGQPFGQEALDELTTVVKDRYVTVGLGHLDQYHRLVGTPYVWRFPYILGPTNISLYLVKQGLATVYTQSGAEYGKSSYLDVLLGKKSSGEVRLLRAQEWAQRRKRGMWGQKHMTTPAAFKKALKGDS